MITKIITHNRPHADELVALMLLKKFPQGKEKFPGVTTAEVSFLTTGELPNGQTAKDFPDTIFLGCGGGDFDEHATSQKERVSNECCTTLVAKYLGISKDPALQRILFFVKQEDLSGSKDRDALSVYIKILHSAYKNDPEGVSRWAIDAYYAEYLSDKNKIENGEVVQEIPPTLISAINSFQKNGFDDLEWWNSFLNVAIKYQDDQYKLAMNEFKNNAKVERFMANDGMPIDMAVITSDNEEMNKVARSNKMQLIIQFSTKGNVAIFTYQKRNLNLTNSFILLRMAEQHYRDSEIKIKDKNILSGEGTVANVPWYLFHTKDCGFNGSLTAMDIPPTKIPHDKVVGLIKQGFKSKF